MARVYFSEKEATALIAVVEEFVRRNPTTKTTTAVAHLPERIAKCVQMQKVERKEKAVSKR